LARHVLACLKDSRSWGKGLGMKGKGEEGTMQARRAPMKRRRPTKPNIMTFQDYKTQLEH